MAWIELHQSLTTHKKTRRLARALGLGYPEGMPQTIGHLCMFWLWCVDGTESGKLEDLDAQDIADAAGWTGDPQTFLDAMVATDFIDETPDGLVIHDWDDYIGRLLAQRKASRERERLRKQKYRQSKREEVPAPEQPEPELPEEGVDFDPEWRKVVLAYEANIGMIPNGIAGEKLASYVEDLSADVVVRAIHATNEAQPDKPWPYLKSILDRWLEQQIDSVEKADAYCLDLQRRIKEAKKRKSQAAAGDNQPPAITGKFY